MAMTELRLVAAAADDVITTSTLPWQRPAVSSLSAALTGTGAIPVTGAAAAAASAATPTKRLNV